MGPIQALLARVELLKGDFRAIARNTGSKACYQAGAPLSLIEDMLRREMPEEGTILPNLGGEIDMGWTGKMPRPSADDLPIYPNGSELPMPVAVEVLR